MFDKHLWSRLVSLLLLSCIVAPALAQAPLDLATALDQTLRHHPLLARIDAQLRQLDPAVALARQAPPLSVGLEAENLGDNSSERLETTLTLSGVLEWDAQRDARGNIAQSRNQSTQLGLEQQRRDVLAKTATRFIELAGAQAGLAQAHAAQELAQQTQQATARRQQAGAASTADVKRADLLLAQTEMQIANATQAVNTARMALQIAMGSKDIAVATVSAPLQDLPPLPQTETLLAAAGQSPAVMLADARLNVARSQLDLARRQARPKLNWNLGIRDQREADEQSLLLGFSLPLGQKSRSQPQRDSALAGLDVATQQRAIAQLELQLLLLDSWQALARWRREAQTLDSQLIPQGEAIAQALREGYTRGRYSLLELSSAAQDLNTLRSQRLAARIAYHQRWIELERLLGRPLVPENPA